MKHTLSLPITLLFFSLFYFSSAYAQNTAYGSGALASNTSGIRNAAFGYQSLYYNTTGGYNSAFGIGSMLSNQSGHNNVAVGHSSMFYNTSGYHNTAVGSGALTYNTSGIQNTGVGMYVLQVNSTGNYNTAQGAFALYNNIASSNTAQGAYALYSNNSGYTNTANGYFALYGNTTGYFNSATGGFCLYSNTTGYQNTAVGHQALYTSSTGRNNAAFGYDALFKITSGSYNVAMGYNTAASYNYTFSTFVGANISTTVGNLTNVTVLGYGVKATASNQVRIGNTSVTSIGGQVGWSTLSDGRFKTQIEEDVPGLAFIKKLRPISYHLDVAGLNKALKGNNSMEEKQEPLTAEEIKAQQDQAKVKYTGFVAQEVEKAAQELNYDFSGVDKPKSKEDLYGLRYEAFVVPLVKAVQEQQQQIELQQKEIEALKELVNKLISGQSPANVTSNNISLEQNTPNPFDHSTSIRYSIPQVFQRAQLLLTDKGGRIIKQVGLTSASGTINLDGSLLSNGSYQYSLIVDGKVVQSKTMILAK
jgi:hypothetical protein